MTKHILFTGGERSSSSSMRVAMIGMTFKVVIVITMMVGWLCSNFTSSNSTIITDVTTPTGTSKNVDETRPSLTRMRGSLNLFNVEEKHIDDSTSVPAGSDDDDDDDNGNMICPLLHCPVDLLNCGINPQCRQALSCNAQCQNKSDEVGCNLLCQFNYGYDNVPYTTLLRCMANNDCLPKLPMNGKCLATSNQTITNLTSYDQIQGQWWIVRGLNCGQDDIWSAGFDAFPCQYDNFVREEEDEGEEKEEDQQWIDHIGYCGGRNSTCTTQFIQTKAAATISKPGVLTHEYLDAPLLPQVEEWFILSWPHPDWMLYVYCGSTPTGPYGGGSVVTRDPLARAPQDIPDWVERIFISVAHQHGFEYQDMCLSDNTQCPSSLAVGVGGGDRSITSPTTGDTGTTMQSSVTTDGSDDLVGSSSVSIA